ncbi:MAG: type I secretion system protein LssZ [Legionella sp.]|nr:type I secretion system protein LssZ [Legionella sp.]
MYILTQAIHCLFPLIALIFLIIGINRQAIYYVISALWLSLIALIIHFEYSGGHLLGDYFNYTNASIYSINLIVLFLSLARVISHLSVDNMLFKYTSSFLKAAVLIGCLVVSINLWVNAFFIEHRLKGTPVIQVALHEKASYCTYRYIFYKFSQDGSVDYLCPNHYGFIPSIGKLADKPNFITSQLSIPGKEP